MQALLSPHSATALAFQDQTAFLIDPGKPPQALPPVEVSAWLSAHEETRWESAEDFPAVETALSLYSRRREALDLALISLDGELSLGLRDEAQQELENLLADDAVADWLLNLFHLRPLEAEAAVDVALFLVRDTKRQRVLAWLKTIVKRQAYIAKSWAAWNVIPEELLQLAGGRQAVEELFLEKGLFTRFSHAIELFAMGRGDQPIFEALVDFYFLDMANSWQIVEAWLRPMISVMRPLKRQSLLDKKNSAYDFIERDFRKRREERLKMKQLEAKAKLQKRKKYSVPISEKTTGELLDDKKTKLID